MSKTATTSLRQRYKALERINKTLLLNSNNATLVANAMFWRLGLKNREEIKAIVDGFIQFTTAQIEKAKAEKAEREREEGTLTVEEFIDPVLLEKARQIEGGEDIEDIEDVTDSTDSDV
jgi:hypothetical protein